MCQILLEENGLEKARELGRNANYVCKRCVRVSEKEENLCEPTSIDG